MPPDCRVFAALYFLAVFPAVEFVEYMHTAHVFPTLIFIS